MEFDIAFTVEHATFADHKPLEYTYDWNVIVPCVELIGNTIDVDSYSWAAITGYSSQHGYTGPIMHPSEQLTNFVLRDIVKRYGTATRYAITEVIDSEDPDNLIGWIMLREMNPYV